jgi:hypothetical protein
MMISLQKRGPLVLHQPGGEEHYEVLLSARGLKQIRTRIRNDPVLVREALVREVLVPEALVREVLVREALVREDTV